MLRNELADLISFSLSLFSFLLLLLLFIYLLLQEPTAGKNNEGVCIRVSVSEEGVAVRSSSCEI